MRAEEDADVIKLMKEAGAILIVNTNIPEFNLWQETRNNVYGQTLNPYNTTRTTGGSSGGEAALIAACGTGFGIGKSGEHIRFYSLKQSVVKLVRLLIYVCYQGTDIGGSI